MQKQIRTWFSAIKTSGKKHPVLFSLWVVVLAAVLLTVYEAGFDHSPVVLQVVPYAVSAALAATGAGLVIAYLARLFRFRIGIWIFDLALMALIIWSVWLAASNRISGEEWTDSLAQGISRPAIFLAFFRLTYLVDIGLSKVTLNPAWLLLLAFGGLSLLGAFLLTLPKATNSPISIIDALFTAVSAVCINGLVVQDTSTFFTPFGQVVIIVLVQLGGLGIMTFASYFSYFFSGNSSFQNQVALSNFASGEKLSEVYNTVRRIISIMLVMEMLGAMVIFFSVNDQFSGSRSEQVYFSVFHSISSFCNAGFSTITGGLASQGFANNYPLLLTITGLFVLGGLGFPILFNLIQFAGYFIRRIFFWRKTPRKAWVLTLNSRLILVVTAWLIVIGTAGIYVFERHHALAGYEGTGAWVSALFTALTPRSSGFNCLDTGGLQPASLLLILFLMWVGASPASTGGGIRTTTFALLMLNLVSLARGQDRIELYRREIPAISVRRALSIVSLSVFSIGAGTIGVHLFDPHLGLMSVAFECVSAFCTVGLSMGITGSLSTGSKAVVILLMFLGRIGMLTLLSALLAGAPMKNYRYASEEILIN